MIVIQILYKYGEVLKRTSTKKTVLNFQHSINQKTPGGRGGIQRKMAGSLGKANSEKERGKRKLELKYYIPSFEN